VVHPGQIIDRNGSSGVLLKTQITSGVAVACLVFSGFVHGKEIRVAVGQSLSPYIIQEKNAGVELEIVAQALANSGYAMKPVYMPFGRIPQTMRRGDVDAAMTLTENVDVGKAYFSDSHIFYQNVAISLHKNGYKIDSAQDLGAHSIVAFQNAAQYLGDKFRAMAEGNKRYGEYAQQVQQNMMLYAGRVDVVVADRNIFNYNNIEAAKRGVNVSQAVIYHEIFPFTPNKVAFRDEEMKNAFNIALMKMRSDGSYDAIMKKHKLK
jgi:polar amino acid transport system substrate-binding protein